MSRSSNFRLVEVKGIFHDKGYMAEKEAPLLVLNSSLNCFEGLGVRGLGFNGFWFRALGDWHSLLWSPGTVLTS